MKRSRPRARPRPSENDAERSAAWFRAVVHPKAVCALCGARRALQGHHLIGQRALKDWARSQRLSREATQAILWDTRNGIPLCSSPCHERITNVVVRFPRSKLPAGVWAFAADLDRLAGTEAMTCRIEREYPCG